MQNFLIKQSSLNGTIKIPPSKSETMRALLFASLAKGKSTIYDYLPSDDTTYMANACEAFGAEFKFVKNEAEVLGVAGKVKICRPSIFAGNSGIILRFCSAILALDSKKITITGDQSLSKRPMEQLIKGLRALDVKTAFQDQNISIPLSIQGPIKPGKIKISGEDSQPVSALLIAASLTKEPIEIEVENPGEKPWVALTLSWFDRLNIPYQNKEFKFYKTFGSSVFNGFSYSIPGDLSTAAFPIGAALVTNSTLTLQNVDMNSLQGDKELIYLFQKMGALIEIKEETKTLYVKKGSSLKGVDADINDFIDSIAILAVVACFASGKTHIYNAKIAKEKECNRLFAISQELKKMGAQIEETKDGLIITPSPLKGALVSSHKDHRIAMALAVAGLGVSGETVILDTSCTSKTYPAFVKDFQSINAHIEEV